MMSLPLRRESVSHNIFVWDDKIVGWWKLLDVKTLLEGCVIVTDSRGGGWFLSWTLSCPLTSCPTTARTSCSPHHTRESRAGGRAGRAGHQPTFLLLLLASCHSLSTIYYLELSSHTVWLCVEHASHGHYDVSRSRNDRSQFSSFHLIVFLQWLVNGRLSKNLCSLIGSSICIYCKCVLHGQWIQTTIYLSTYTRYYLHLFIINLVYMFFSAITMLALCILSNSWPK